MFISLGFYIAFEIRTRISGRKTAKTPEAIENVSEGNEP
jgi:hypothetical protein